MYAVALQTNATEPISQTMFLQRKTRNALVALRKAASSALSPAVLYDLSLQLQEHVPCKGRPADPRLERP